MPRQLLECYPTRLVRYHMWQPGFAIDQLRLTACATLRAYRRLAVNTKQQLINSHAMLIGLADDLLKSSDRR